MKSNFHVAFRRWEYEDAGWFKKIFIKLRNFVECKKK